MNVTANAVQELRAGAARASAGNLHRLAKLLDGLADLARMTVDEDDIQILALAVPEVIERGQRVARDVCRSPE